MLETNAEVGVAHVTAAVPKPSSGKTHWTAYVTAIGMMLVPVSLGGVVFAMIQLGDRARFQLELKFDQVVEQLKVGQHRQLDGRKPRGTLLRSQYLGADMFVH